MIPSLLQQKNFIGAEASWEEADWILIGIPYDGTCSYRPGARFAPQAIREASWGLETYSPFLERSMEALKIADVGDLELPFGNRNVVLDRIYEAARTVVKAQKKWLGMGGEHLVTLPVIQAYLDAYPDLAVIQFDAHTDLREDYMGETLSHATVMRRVVDLVEVDRVAQIGIRSGTFEEYAWMAQHNTLMKTPADLVNRLTQWDNLPVFLTIDLDVLDPSVLPGTGTPEPGGLTFRELQSWFEVLKTHHIVGIDVVELSPPYDVSGVSNIVAAKAIRESVLLTASNSILEKV